MSLPIRYGRPKTARRKTRKGFLEGRGGEAGEPSGFGGGVRPWKAKNAEGVRDVASAGGGRPVTRARRVRSQRRRVKMPRMEPRVCRREDNCSATDTMAVGGFSHVVMD